MRSPALAVLILIGAFFAWYTHDRWWPSFRGTVKSAGQHIPESVRPGWVDNTETVYKWQDETGKWHVSNEPPRGVTNYQTERVQLDKNIIPPPDSKKKETRTRPGKRARKDYR